MGRRASSRAIRSEEGFAFTELLVVVIILGILAAIAITVFLQQREKAEASSAISAVRNIMGIAATEYTGTYPEPAALGLPSAYTLVSGSEEATPGGAISIDTYEVCGEEPGIHMNCIAMAVRAVGDCFWAWQAQGGAAAARERGPITESRPCTAQEAASIEEGDRF